MNKKLKRDCILYALPIVLLCLTIAWALTGTNVSVLNPQGIIASKQHSLLITATCLMLIVGIPVFVLAFTVAWKYRKENTGATYAPDWDYSFWIESLWWGVPGIIIVVLSLLVWQSSHELDPFRPLNTPKKPITIQVVALNWRWLFIYPEQKIATVNYLKFPEKTPINFEITADAPMNSFWIPALGGQMYAMPAMVSKIHLMADSIGSYPGSSANLSGKGFAGMRFIASSVSDDAFDAWVRTTRASGQPLTVSTYKQLAEPYENSPELSFALRKKDLFDWIVMKYMMPMEGAM